MTKFSKGDRVRVENNCSGVSGGSEHTLYFQDGELWAGKDCLNRCSCATNWKKIGGTVEFKIGDRVKCINPNDDEQNTNKFNKSSIYILEENGEKLFDVKNDNGFNHTMSQDYLNNNFKLIRGTMSIATKYDELKDRIEANRVAELGWGKEFDDILQEITNNYYAICMTTTNKPCATSVKIINFSGTYKLGEQYTEFKYRGQCEKNTALHDAALWLLDHSNIKKDEKADKIKALEESIKDIQRQIGELK